MQLAKFQIQGQRLINSIFKVNKEFKKSSNINLDYKTDVVIKKDEVNNRGIVTLNLILFDENFSNEAPFYLFLEIEGLFNWENDLDNVDEYLQVNAPAILLSYLRSITIQVTTMAGFPPLNIPLINFSKSK